MLLFTNLRVSRSWKLFFVIYFINHLVDFLLFIFYFWFGLLANVNMLHEYLGIFSEYDIKHKLFLTFDTLTNPFLLFVNTCIYRGNLPMLFRIGRQKVKVKVSNTLKTNVLIQENKTSFFYQRTAFSCFVLFWLFCLFIYDADVILAVWHDSVFICSDYWNSWYCDNGVDFHFNVIKTPACSSVTTIHYTWLSILFILLDFWNICLIKKVMIW